MANEELKQVGELLSQVKVVIVEMLAPTPHTATSALIGHTLDQLVNRVHFLGGNAPVSTATQEFPPISEFMGEPINRPVSITEAQLITPDLERQIYTDKVEALYDTFDELSTEKILNSYTIPEDVLVLRGVAKKAGVKDFATAELTVPFIDAIRGAMFEKELEAEEKARFEESLKNQEKARVEKELEAEMNSSMENFETESDADNQNEEHISDANEDLTTQPGSNEPAPGVNEGPADAGLSTSETTTTSNPAPSTSKGGKKK